MNDQQKLQLSREVNRVASVLPVRMLALCYLRYEKIRLLNPRQFSEIYARNLAGEGSFDDLVDGLEGPV